MAYGSILGQTFDPSSIIISPNQIEGVIPVSKGGTGVTSLSNLVDNIMSTNRVAQFTANVTENTTVVIPANTYISSPYNRLIITYSGRLYNAGYIKILLGLQETSENTLTLSSCIGEGAASYTVRFIIDAYIDLKNIESGYSVIHLLYPITSSIAEFQHLYWTVNFGFGTQSEPICFQLPAGSNPAGNDIVTFDFYNF